ncbi:MAG: hypothetical protein FD180_1393 [Planctomycetota bacterium]|nr:MAG: hypothetical protein FD180_1393 [Planctomycetota bacterium]
MIRTIGSAVALALLLTIQAFAQGTPDSQPKDPKEEGGAKEEGAKEEAEDPGDPAALKALQDGVDISTKKKYTLKGGLDVEVAGASMFAIELQGEHAGKWTHFKTEVMGNAVEIYTDGETTLSLNAQTGAWEKQTAGAGGGGGGGGGGRGGRGGRGGFRGGLGMDQVAKAVKTAKFDGEAKVGSHVCKVIRAKTDAESIRKLLGGGKMGGGEVKKSSLKFYVDKEDGRLRRMKLTMDALANMQGQGGMELHITSDYRYTYSKGIKVELPEEAKAVLEEKKEEPKDEKKEEGADPEAPKSGEGSGDGK